MTRRAVLRRVAALALATTASAAGARAQSRAITIVGSAGSTTVTPALHRGYPALPIDALRRLGVQTTQAPEGARVVAFGDTLLLHTLSPFFTDRGRLQHLADPVYQEGGVVYVPLQFVVEWLPAVYPDHVTFANDTLRLGRAPARGPSAADTARRGAGGAVPASNRSSTTSPPPPPPSHTPAGRPADRTRVVIVDAGHGGRDNGATGPGGVHEKDVTLAIARRLAEQLRRRDYEVHLTRSADTLISLFDRPRLANHWKENRPATLFVSIHANSLSNHSVDGFETFFLAPARTADERAVAERENAAAAYDDEGAEKGTDELGFILGGLRNDYYVRASRDLAQSIQGEMADFHPGTNRGVKQAAFVVLVGAYMPAVLVEAAFVSNPEEARMLTSSPFQEKVAWAIADGVDEFFEKHEYLWDPDGT